MSNFTQTGDGCQQIGTQNNYTNFKFKALKLNDQLDIKVHPTILNIFVFKELFLVIFFLSLACIYLIVSPLFNSSFLAQVHINYFQFFGYSILLFFFINFVFLVFLYIGILIKWGISSKLLIITDSSIKLGQKELQFKDIRSMMKKKDLVGFSIYIYKVDEIYPTLEFNVESIHLANAIEEIILNKLTF